MHGSKKPSTEVDARSIPKDMIEARRWLLWRPEMRDGQWSKVPYRVDRPDVKASSTDPDSWGEFPLDWPDGHGLGFVLGDGWVGIDFDDVAESKDAEEITRWVAGQSSYAEVSVSGDGIHVIMRGVEVPAWAACRRVGAPVEVYKGGRYFTVTGHSLAPERPIMADQKALEGLLRRWLDRRPSEAPRAPERPSAAPRASIDPSASDFSLVARMAERKVPRDVAEAALRTAMQAQGRGEKAARPDYIPRTVDRAYGAVEDAAPPEAPLLEPATLGARAGERLPPREVLIDGIARRGDVMNIIAAPKVGKSWLVQDLAVSMCGDASWLGRPLKAGGGRVLLVDNELHPQEGEPRLEMIAAHKGVPLATVHERLEVLWMREKGLEPLEGVERLLSGSPGRWDLVVLDALYRFLPAGCDENSNSDIVQLYNRLDAMARNARCLLAIVHHTSKGDQSGKATTDVGSGASSAARAADVHLALRPHEEDGAFVVSMALRSFPELKPFVVRRDHPIFVRDEELDPEALRRPGPKPKGEEINTDQFTNRFVNGRRSRSEVIQAAQAKGVSRRLAQGMLLEAIEQGLVAIESVAKGVGRPREIVVAVR
jgi:hypothetical protein